MFIILHVFTGIYICILLILSNSIYVRIRDGEDAWEGKLWESLPGHQLEYTTEGKQKLLRQISEKRRNCIFDACYHHIKYKLSWLVGGVPLPTPVLVLAPTPSSPPSDSRVTTDIKEMPTSERLWYQRDADTRNRELRSNRILRTWMSANSSLKRQSVSQSVTNHRVYYVN